MVHLSRIYTRQGDDGDTRLGDGSSLSKNHPRVASYGTIDELSSVLGLAIVDSIVDSIVDTRDDTRDEADPKAMAEGDSVPWRDWLGPIQNDLFDVGSDLCVPGEAGQSLRITAAYTARLEGWIDQVNEHLEALDSFILPGGTRAAAWLHLGRTVCRRAERLVVELMGIDEERDRVNPEVLKYINRLSDLLFVLARMANNGGRDDVLWRPGGDR